MTDHIEVRGRSGRLEATLRYDDMRLHWRAKKPNASSALEEFVAELDEIKHISLTENRWTSLSAFGAVALGLGIFWLLHASAPAVFCIAIAACGFALVALRLVDPKVTVSFRAAGHGADLRVTRACITNAVALVSEVESARPVLKTSRTAGLWTTLGKSMRDLCLPDASLRSRYRAIAGAGATSHGEERAVRMQRRIAAWNVGWLIALPLLAAVSVQFAMVSQPPSGLLVRSVLWYVIFFSAFAMLQSRLLRVHAVKVWMSG